MKALSAKVLHTEEAREAGKLVAQHEEGIKFSESLAKQFDYEIQEAQLHQQKIMSVSERVVVGQPIPLTNESAKIHVEVRPQPLPEHREIGGEVPSAERRQATMEEKIPEELAKQAAEIDTPSALNKSTKTTVQVQKETTSVPSPSDFEEAPSSRGVGAGDVLNAVVGMITGQKQ